VIFNKICALVRVPSSFFLKLTSLPVSFLRRNLSVKKVGLFLHLSKLEKIDKEIIFELIFTSFRKNLKYSRTICSQLQLNFLIDQVFSFYIHSFEENK